MTRAQMQAILWRLKARRIFEKKKNQDRDERWKIHPNQLRQLGAVALARKVDKQLVIKMQMVDGNDDVKIN